MAKTRYVNVTYKKNIKQIKPALKLHVPYKSEIKQKHYQQSNESVWLETYDARK